VLDDDTIGALGHRQLLGRWEDPVAGADEK
jgi:hypothetical protein